MPRSFPSPFADGKSLPPPDSRLGLNCAPDQFANLASRPLTLLVMVLVVVGSNSVAGAAVGTTQPGSPVVLGTDHRSVLGEVDSLLDGYNCTHVYLDVGTNRGVQIRKLFQPPLPRRQTPRFCRTLIWSLAPPPRCPSVCAIGFEPNPRHWDHLDRLQGALRAAGAGYVHLGLDSGHLPERIVLRLSCHLHG